MLRTVRVFLPSLIRDPGSNFVPWLWSEEKLKPMAARDPMDALPKAAIDRCVSIEYTERDWKSIYNIYIYNYIYIYIILIYYIIHFFPGLECSLHFNSTWPSERHVVKTLLYTAASLKLRSIVGEWLRNAKGFRSALNALKLRHLPICPTTAHMLEAPKVSVEV